MRHAMILLSVLLPLATAANAQTPADAKARQAQEAEQRLHEDWAWLGRYQPANAALAPSATGQRVVFIGDSITQGWFDKVPSFFGPDRVDRGIGGQTTPQMVLRFHQDVIDLHPAAVQIMGGTNDIASNRLTAAGRPGQGGRAHRGSRPRPPAPSRHSRLRWGEPRRR